MPVSLLGKLPAGLPYTIWQLVEHLRITQKDILDFSRDDGKYKSMNWPAEYWPDELAPANEAQWEKSLKEIETDQQAFISLLKKSGENGLFEKFAHGDGQTLFREALLIIDHNSYHTGQIILVRRLLHDWES
ncbi:MAG: DinB family protein [Mucilaginibacter polytrichastri]|nr:DinB family protein [Mucilaginibacter polytrichastri]